jgi:Ca2+-binding RTX toxin-like protein
MNADGTNVKRLTTDETIDARPAWSPDGRWIMFQSEQDRPGLRDLYLVRPDGSGVESYSTGGQWATSPDWQAVRSLDRCDACGTILADDLEMFEGNDRICGLAGNDRIKAGEGNDTVIGGPGRDRISCGPGRDTVITDGHDVIAKDCEIRKKG